MIFSKIPFRIWERVIRIGSSIFFTISIISPFLGLTFYLFESDFESFLAAKHENIKQRKKNITKKTTYSSKNLFDTPTKPFIPAPNIEDCITFSYHNTRPGQDNESDKALHLDTKEKSVTCKENEKIYLVYTADESVEFSEEKTPFSITPRIHSENEVALDYTVCYEDAEENTLYENTESTILKKSSAQYFSLSRSSRKAIKQLNKCFFLKEDKLISEFGGKDFEDQKNKYRLIFEKTPDKPIIHVKEHDILCFCDDHFEVCHKDQIKKPVFQVQHISEDCIEGRFWNENGFYERSITILPYTNIDNDPLEENIFEEAYRGKGGIVFCRLAGKIHVISPGDWLCKYQNTWRVLKSKAELEKILSFQTPMKLLIFKDVIKIDNQKCFYGYLFDKTRTRCKKLEIPLKKKRNL